jgi:rubredoxin
MPTVEMRAAFAWTCDECGRDHFARAVAAPLARVLSEVSDDDREAVEDMPGDWVMAPDRVQCPDCGAAFNTADS